MRKTTPPTVLFILHLPPPVHGAAMVGKYIHDSGLINKAFDCHYINLTTARSLTDIGKFGFRKIGQYLRLIWRIRTEVRRVKPRLVYVTPNACGPAFYKDFIVVQMLKRMGCRVVVHYHNKGVATRQERALDDFLYRRFFKGIKVILLAKTLYDDVQKYVKWQDVYICPNGIPEALSAEPPSERHNKIPHLLFLSNLLESKGVLVLLDACKILKDKGYSFVCDFVGGETAEISARRFEREVEDRELNRVTVYHGRKYGDDKHRFFRESDIFVFPTYYNNETFGLVNLEAMEFKLPVITTNEGGIPDVIKDGENGLISEKGDAESLSRCIECLLNDKELRNKMGEDGYRKFKEKFTLLAFESNCIETLRNVIASGGVKCNYIYYYGRRYGDEKECFWHDTDIFIFPTYYNNECFPLVLLEAMQHGVACISSSEGGIPDIIENGKTGFIVDKCNPEQLAEKIELLFKSPALGAELGRNGRKRFEERFRLGVFEETISGILEDIVSLD